MRERGRFEPFVMYSPYEARYFDDLVGAISERPAWHHDTYRT